MGLEVLADARLNIKAFCPDAEIEVGHEAAPATKGRTRREAAIVAAPTTYCSPPKPTTDTIASGSSGSMRLRVVATNPLSNAIHKMDQKRRLLSEIDRLIAAKGPIRSSAITGATGNNRAIAASPGNTSATEPRASITWTATKATSTLNQLHPRERTAAQAVSSRPRYQASTTRAIGGAMSVTIAEVTRPATIVNPISAPPVELPCSKVSGSVRVATMSPPRAPKSAMATRMPTGNTNMAEIPMITRGRALMTWNAPSSTSATVRARSKTGRVGTRAWPIWAGATGGSAAPVTGAVPAAGSVAGNSSGKAQGASVTVPFLLPRDRSGRTRRAGHHPRPRNHRRVRNSVTFAPDIGV